MEYLIIIAVIVYFGYANYSNQKVIVENQRQLMSSQEQIIKKLKNQ